MTFAAIADVHGNCVAVEAVLLITVTVHLIDLSSSRVGLRRLD
jgi:hypothetical protein